MIKYSLTNGDELAIKKLVDDIQHALVGWHLHGVIVSQLSSEKLLPSDLQDAIHTIHYSRVIYRYAIPYRCKRIRNAPSTIF